MFTNKYVAAQCKYTKYLQNRFVLEMAGHITGYTRDISVKMYWFKLFEIIYQVTTYYGKIKSYPSDKLQGRIDNKNSSKSTTTV
jgi:hypothetical protein